MIKNPLTCLDRYDPSWALAPVWEGNTLYNESVLLVEDADGRRQAPLPLPAGGDPVRAGLYLENHLCPRQGLERVRRQICRRPRLPLPCFPYEEFYCLNNPPADSVMNYAFGRHILVGPGHVFQPRVVNVTYTHKGAWRWQKPAFKGDRLPRTLEKLRRGQPLTFVFYGDSVVSGDEVTSFLNLEPHTPIWSEMFCRRLEEAYGSPIRLVDTAVGGHPHGMGWSICRPRWPITIPTWPSSVSATTTGSPRRNTKRSWPPWWPTCAVPVRTRKSS